MITKLKDSSVKQIAAGAAAIEYSSPLAIISGGIQAYQTGGFAGLLSFAKIIYQLLA